MFKRLFEGLYSVLKLIGLSAIIGYGLEAGKDSYKKHSKKKEEKVEGTI